MSPLVTLKIQEIHLVEICIFFQVNPLTASQLGVGLIAETQ